ncbi:MAG: type II secretion system F family protein [Planctomycetaceae bacterium]|nr:type II secretion system F family protein [Planctomycetaceae bacterium]
MQLVHEHIDVWQWRLAMTGSSLLGIAVFLLISRVLLIVDRHIRTFAEEWEFEQSRRVKLRHGSRVYRLTEPLIDELCETRLMKLFGIDRISLAISRGGDPLPWKAKEFISVSMMESLLLFLAIMLFGSGFTSVLICLAAGLLFSAVFLRASLKSVCRKADRRIELIQRRLPFGIDLISLMMRAGAGFRDALATVVSESGRHPFADEFYRVLSDVSHGKTLHEALSDLDQRLRSDDVREMVFAIKKSEELGTPLAEIFSNLADQMRLRKSQWAEAAAGKAQIKIHGPQLIIMVACMLTILAPFIFEGISTYL